MAATVTFGVAPLLFLQLTYAKPVYSAAIVSAWFWLDIIGAVIVGYYCLYASAFANTLKTNRLPIYLSVAAIMALYVALVYSTVFSMVEKPDVYEALYAANQSGLVVNTDIGHWLVRWIHMILGAFTVGAFFVGVIGKDDDAVFTMGKKFFLFGMIATMVIGFVYLFTLGEHLVAVMRSPVIWAVTAGTSSVALLAPQFLQEELRSVGASRLCVDGGDGDRAALAAHHLS